MTTQPESPSTPAPDPALSWASRVIMRVEVGSTAHGTGLPGGEDYDEMGIMVEPWQSAVGISDGAEHIIYRPGRATGERSQPGDYDLVVYTARKFARLAASGNPSVLMAFFGPLRFSTPLGDELRALAPAFWHEGARQRFLGYAKAQRERMTGERGGKHTNRPELVEVHGYDTKYAMHMLRLCFQGIEYMQTGRLTLPIDDPNGAFLRDVRLGKYTRDEVIERAEALEDALKMLKSRAPAQPDHEAINAWLLRAHRTVLP